MAEALGTKSHPASFLKVSTLQDFNNLISSLQSTLCDLDLINLARTSSLMHGDSMMKIPTEAVPRCMAVTPPLFVSMLRPPWRSHDNS